MNLQNRNQQPVDCVSTSPAETRQGQMGGPDSSNKGEREVMNDLYSPLTESVILSPDSAGSFSSRRYENDTEEEDFNDTIIYSYGKIVIVYLCQSCLVPRGYFLILTNA